MCSNHGKNSTYGAGNSASCEPTYTPGFSGGARYSIMVQPTMKFNNYQSKSGGYQK